MLALNNKNKRSIYELRPKLATEHVYVREGDEECALYVLFSHKNKHRLLCLNNYAKEVLQLCDGKHSIGDIVNILCKKYHLPNDFTFNEVLKFLKLLEERGIIIWG